MTQTHNLNNNRSPENSWKKTNQEAFVRRNVEKGSREEIKKMCIGGGETH